jgi:hypothetical protein
MAGKVDTVLDNIFVRVEAVRASVMKKAFESKNQVNMYVNGAVDRYNKEKDQVMVKAKGYKSALSEQIQVIKSENPVGEITAKVKQAPEMVRSLSNKAVAWTKQGLEKSIGQEKYS